MFPLGPLKHFCVLSRLQCASASNSQHLRLWLTALGLMRPLGPHLQSLDSASWAWLLTSAWGYGTMKALLPHLRSGQVLFPWKTRLKLPFVKPGLKLHPPCPIPTFLLFQPLLWAPLRNGQHTNPCVGICFWETWFKRIWPPPSHKKERCSSSYSQNPLSAYLSDTHVNLTLLHVKLTKQKTLRVTWQVLHMNI